MLLAMILAAGSASAQTKTGTTIGQFLGVDTSARHAAMGGAGVALGEGIESVYYNPGAIGGLGRLAAQFTHSEYFADINFDYVAAAVPVTWGTLFVSVTSLNSGEIDVRTVAQPLGTGERYTVSDVALGMGYGRRITDLFTAGAQVNYVRERIWHSTLETVTFSFGTVYTLPVSGVNIGASLSNLGTSGRYNGRDLAIQFDNDPDRYGDNSSLPGEQLTDDFSVPILFRVGATLPRRTGRESTLLISVDAFHPNDNTESVSAGGEWTWKETLALRAGYQHLFQDDSEVGLTLGAGIRTGIGENRLRFDYAWTTHENLDETHRTTFAVEF
jgi:long-subunit fatty acid transport protein